MTDADIINQVRELTNYDSSIMDQSTMETLLQIGKDEILVTLNPDEEFDFYAPENAAARRALFWFTAIAAKVKAGEIASVNLTVGSIRTTSYAGSKFDYYFENFEKRIGQAEKAQSGGGPAMRSITRADERDYEFDVPEDNTTP